MSMLKRTHARCLTVTHCETRLRDPVGSLCGAWAVPFTYLSLPRVRNFSWQCQESPFQFVIACRSSVDAA